MSMGQFDLIVSNPPYVPSFEVMTLDSSVRDFEPLGALDGGEDGLMFYRSILHNWISVLRPGGLLMFEVGEDQAPAVRALMRDQQLQDVFSVQDTAGIDRVVIGRRAKE
jgi:release factor glutamine methyltransferase